ncbi:MAG: hypothetical protein DWH81_07190 [Planctomycetota bacterium]|nr:MAG: hypothetical protein DWH81_07190 [Planctomycetota bacterium]
MWERLIAQRRMIGWLGAIGLLAGGILSLSSADQRDGLGGSLFRAGVVLAALWLALPARFVPGTMTFSIWQGLGFLSVMLALVRRPWIVVPVLVIMGLLSLFTRRRG